MPPMPYYERLYPLAVLACLAAGVACFAQSEMATASQDFIAVALAIRLDEQMRRRWALIDERPGARWQRQRTPV